MNMPRTTTWSERLHEAGQGARQEYYCAKRHIKLVQVVDEARHRRPARPGPACCSSGGPSRWRIALLPPVSNSSQHATTEMAVNSEGGSFLQVGPGPVGPSERSRGLPGWPGNTRPPGPMNGPEPALGTGLVCRAIDPSSRGILMAGRPGGGEERARARVCMWCSRRCSPRVAAALLH